MRTVFCAAILMANLPVVALGQSDTAPQSEPIALPLLLNAGQIKKVSYNRLKTANKNGVTTKQEAIVAATLSVLSVGDETAQLSWTTSSVTIDGEIFDRANPKSAEYLIGVPLEFIAGLDGAPLEIVDAQKVIDDVFNAPPIKAGDPKATEATKQMFMGMEPASLAQVLLKAPSFASLCQGTSFRVGEAREFETELPNPLGGGTLPANGQYLLTTDDDGEGRAHISWRQQIDPQEGKANLLAGLRNFLADAASSKPEALAELDKLPLDIRYDAECDVNRKDGWVSQMDYRIAVSLGIAESLETWSITISD